MRLQLLNLFLLVTPWITMVASEICTDPVCQYTFNIRKRRTMTYRHVNGTLYDVISDNIGLKIVPNLFKLDDGSDPLINTYVDPENVLTADGAKRNIITINDQFPGPVIEVMENSEVVVNVENNLPREALSIHWHGMYMKDYQRFDGVAYITQCPILPRQSFQYRFKAYPSGTHWYHAHLKAQRMDGLYGMVVVHKAPPVLPSHQLLIQDFTETDFETIMLTNPFMRPLAGSGEYYIGFANRDKGIDGVDFGWQPNPIGIINGRGRRRSATLPLERLTVEPYQRYRFRMVHTGAEYRYEFSIDGHEFDVVASDGYDIKPIRVTSLIIDPAETMDIEVETNQPGGIYWIRLKTPKFSPPSVDPTPHLGFGVLAYNGYDGGSDPESVERTCTENDKCRVFNCHFKGFADNLNKECLNFNDAQSTRPTAELDYEFGITDNIFIEKFLVIGTQAGVNINNKAFVLPRAPLLGNDNYYEYITDCDTLNCTQGCRCTHFVDLPYDVTVQLVMSNRAGIFSHHPMHIHGHGMAVLKLGFPDYDPNTGRVTEANNEILCESDYCNNPQWNGEPPSDVNQVNPPIKDTIVVPARGYAIVRFRANNPGLWFFHCHLNNHIALGMTLVFREAVERIKPLPPGFPKCGNYRERDEL